MTEQMRNMPDLLHWRSLHLKFSNPLHCQVFFTGEQNLQSISNSLSSNLSLILAFQNFHFLLFYQGLFQFTVLHHNWPGSMCNWRCCTTIDQAVCAIDIVAPQMMHLRIPKTFTEWVAQPQVLSDTTYRVTTTTAPSGHQVNGDFWWCLVASLDQMLKHTNRE
jgi:hypothetical protein